MDNFGIVSRIDFDMLPIGETFARSISNDFTCRQDVMRAFVDIANAPSYDVHVSFGDESGIQFGDVEYLVDADLHITCYGPSDL
jgi:hypothetical protein